MSSSEDHIHLQRDAGLIARELLRAAEQGGSSEIARERYRAEKEAQVALARAHKAERERTQPLHGSSDYDPKSAMHRWDSKSISDREKAQQTAELFACAGEPAEIVPWLDLEEWTADDASVLISGFFRASASDIYAGGFIRLDGLRLFDDLAVSHLPQFMVDSLRYQFERAQKSILTKWTKDSRGCGRSSPSRFIEWAIGRDIAVGWLPWACNKNLYPIPVRRDSTKHADGGALRPLNFGNHSTKLLRSFEAAYERFWSRYDPTDPDTAPLSTDVIKWLVDEKKVSEKVAISMATMLRVDDLKKGRRRSSPFP